jgi:hypothetical protein
MAQGWLVLQGRGAGKGAEKVRVQQIGDFETNAWQQRIELVDLGTGQWFAFAAPGHRLLHHLEDERAELAAFPLQGQGKQLRHGVELAAARPELRHADLLRGERKCRRVVPASE